MDAYPTPETPEAVTRLATQLQSDCGNATVTITPEGFSHAQSQQKFSLVLISKQQVLNALLATLPGINILKVHAKRSGATVRTTVNLKVDNSFAHAQTALS